MADTDAAGWRAGQGPLDSDELDRLDAWWRLMILDETCLDLPDSPANQWFGRAKSGRGKGVGRVPAGGWWGWWRPASTRSWTPSRARTRSGSRRWPTSVVGAMAYLPEDFDAVIAAMAEGKYSAEGWVAEITADRLVHTSASCGKDEHQGARPGLAAYRPGRTWQ